MKREIKFRAWNKEGKFINNFIDLTFFEEQGIWTYPQENCEWVIMQFTGLHDKNGKEIYEGDIVKTEPTTYGKRDPMEVFFADGIFYPFGQEPGLDDGNYAWYPNASEVIGNIYENLELLKEDYEQK